MTLRLAHRGDWRRHPENTIPAILAALAIPGCDGVEFDVRAAADGTPVLLHDVTLARVQGRPERVDQLSPEGLARLGVPPLAEVLGAVGREPFLDVELKGDPGPAVIDVLESGRGPDLRNAAVSSFESGTIGRLRGARPRWPVWLNADDLSERTIRRAVDLGCAAVSVRWRAVNVQATARARDAGLDVAAWTVREPGAFERLATLGVVAVCVEGAALDGR